MLLWQHIFSRFLGYEEPAKSSAAASAVNVLIIWAIMVVVIFRVVIWTAAHHRLTLDSEVSWVKLSQTKALGWQWYWSDQWDYMPNNMHSYLKQYVSSRWPLASVADPPICTSQHRLHLHFNDQNNNNHVLQGAQQQTHCKMWQDRQTDTRPLYRPYSVNYADNVNTVVCQTRACAFYEFKN